MHHKKTIQLVLAMMGVIGLTALDRGPLVSLAYAQRSNDDDDDDRGGDRPRGRGRGEWGGPGGGFRGRGRRDFGGNGEGGGERQRRRNDDGDEDRPNRDRSDDSGPSTTEFAQQLVKDRDKNGNMILEGEELEGLRGREARADANGDKAITVEEIVAALSDRSGSANRPSSGARGNRGSENSRTASDKSAAADGTTSRVYLGLAAVMSALSDDKAKNEASKRRTYRFTPVEERLPSGLP